MFVVQNKGIFRVESSCLSVFFKKPFWLPADGHVYHSRVTNSSKLARGLVHWTIDRSTAYSLHI